MKKSISLLLLSLLMITPSCQKPKEVTNEYNIVPQPNQLVPKEGRFELSNKVRLVVPSDAPEVKKVADGFAEQLKQTAGISLKEAESVDGKPAISFVLQEGMPKEGYKLSVTPTLITVTASQPNGFFYGVQTIYQLLPPAVYGKELKKKADWSVPAVEIEDAPRFVHRGLMLDVCRHYAPIEYIYKFIDLLAMNKMNVFHWHLTDDQGWRIEIKKYPKLTEIGSKREKTLVDYYYVNYPQVFDGIEHGGYYTQEQIKEVVAYAASKYINVIPEIEMPGHALAALAAYPELSCDSTQTYKVSPTWGVFEQVFCPSETTFKFFEGVMDEVVELFPSEYIHIGGDECPKTAWKNSAFCQQLIRQLGLKDDVTPSKVDGMKHSKEDKLQSYFVTRMEKYLNGKGRNIIGWDEILEGGLAPNATVMSWRGMDGGIEAAKQKHNVVMTPNTYVYLDYYQSADTDLEPDAIGGYLPLEKVYSFEPTAGISPEDQKYVIGAQANLWTEYIPTFSQVEYMIMPRIDAVADIQWSDPSKKDYQTFLPRVARMTQLYDRLGYNYGKHIFDINASLTTNTENGTLDIALTKLGEGDIYYTIDGSDPTIASIKYEGPVQINQDCEFKAIVVRPNGTSRIFSEDIFFNKATMKPITLKEQPSKGYVFNGAQVLVDGLRGGSNYKTGHWLGFQGKDLDATIDLKEPTEIQKVSFNTNVVKGDWIMGASAVTVKVSDDGKNFKEVASKKIPELTQNDKDGLYPQEISFAPVKARYVEVIINSSKLPKWHGGAGSPAFLFVDEIEIL